MFRGGGTCLWYGNTANGRVCFQCIKWNWHIQYQRAARCLCWDLSLQLSSNDSLMGKPAIFPLLYDFPARPFISSYFVLSFILQGICIRCTYTYHFCWTWWGLHSNDLNYFRIYSPSITSVIWLQPQNLFFYLILNIWHFTFSDEEITNDK